VTERKTWLWIGLGALVVVLILLPLAAAWAVGNRGAEYLGAPW